MAASAKIVVDDSKMESSEMTVDVIKEILKDSVDTLNRILEMVDKKDLTKVEVLSVEASDMMSILDSVFRVIFK